MLERDRELREFLPPQFRAVSGKREYPLFSWDGWARGALSPHKREHPSVELWTRFLDATEIAMTVLYPNEGLNIGLQRDRDWAVALAHAYNDWLHHDFLSVNPRFQGVALLAPQEPLEAAKELERSVRELGMVAGMLPGVMSPMRGLGTAGVRSDLRDGRALRCAARRAQRTGGGAGAWIMCNPSPASIRSAIRLPRCSN